MKKIKIELILIFTIAILTPIAATLLYIYNPPQATTNFGELLNPTSLDENILPPEYADWQLLVADVGDCDLACQERLCVITQLRLVNIGEINRISRLLLVDTNSQIPAEIKIAPSCNQDVVAAQLDLDEIEVIEGLSIARIAKKEIQKLLQQNNETNFVEYIYLVDPKLQIMMRYPQDTPIKNIVKDLKRLLRLSKTIS